MSLILEALKKVERERATPEQRGFLVLGPAAWAPARSNAGWILGIVGAAAVAGGLVYALTRPAAGTAAGSGATAAEAARDAPAPPSTAPPAVLTQAPPATAWAPPAQPAPRAARSAAAMPTPAPAAPAAAPALVLHAISEQDGVPIAVIDHRVVREGDRFGAVRVLRIGTAEVEVEVSGARRVLRF